MRDLFYNNDAFNTYGIPNIWDEDSADTNCGFFCPKWANLEIFDEEGKALLMDKDGNTLHEKAREWLRVERQKVIDNAPTSMDVDAYLIENSICPQESFLTLSGSIFPKLETLSQLARVRGSKLLSNFKQVGMLERTPSGLKWHQYPGNKGDIDIYPTPQNIKTDGAMVIWEHPKSDRPQPYLYVAGLDSYDQNEAESSTSLGSLLIWKRAIPGDEFSNTLVAEYTARPETSDEFYQNCVNLLQYYNATCMYENMNKGVYTYMYNRGVDHLLADQPDSIIGTIVTNSRVNRKKGVHMTKEIKSTGLIYAKELLYTPFEEDPDKKTLDYVYSTPLLQELSVYSPARNCDRVSALIVLAIYLKQLESYTLKPDRLSDDEKRRKLITMPFFTDDPVDLVQGYKQQQEIKSPLRPLLGVRAFRI